jgi:hypothetical protein
MEKNIDLDPSLTLGTASLFVFSWLLATEGREKTKEAVPGER